MQTIETLAGLERRLDLNVSAADLEKEVALRLSRLARTVRMPGFRPGKVPLKMVAASYGAQVQAEVLNDKVGEALNSAVTANNLRVAGTPRVDPKPEADADGRDHLAFSATFEVYPEIRVDDVQSASVQRATCLVGEQEIDKTLAIMRKQRATFALVERAAADGDRVTVDFVGT